MNSNDLEDSGKHLLDEKTCRTGRLSKLAHVNEATVWRWFTKGVVVNGERIILESCFVGGVRISSEESLARFSDKIMAARGIKIAMGARTDFNSPKSHERRSQQAAKELEKTGA